MNDIPNGRDFAGVRLKDGARATVGGVWYVYDESCDVLRKVDLGPQRGPSSVAKIQAETKQMLAQMGPKKSKYRNAPTIVDGIRFASKAEAGYYEKLKLLRERCEVLWFIMQVPFRLPGGVKYVADFLVVYRDRFEVVDVKGMETAMFKLKKKQVEEAYGISITVVKKVK
jgi:hypothetical protein